MPSKTKLTLGALTAGAAGAFFFDAQDGRRRRDALRKRVAAILGGSAGQLATDVQIGAAYAESAVHGAAHQAASEAPSPSADRNGT